jgi:hypothetical protein
MLLTCPRCSGALPPDAHACPRCGLLLSSVTTAEAEQGRDAALPNGREAEIHVNEPDAIVQTQPVDYSQSPGTVSGTAPYDPIFAPPSSVPVRPLSSDAYTATPVPEAPATAASPLLVPRGAVEMLPNESVVFQLGALYLTNKRVILLAPSVLRTAFLRDVDAVGTVTERASGWSFFFGLLMLAIAAGAVYLSVMRTQLQQSLEALYKVDPLIIAGLLGIFAIYLLVNYFFWVKRTLFLSVGGRPLITVSITDWNANKLAGMDAFINAYSQVKDASNAGETVE